MINLIQKEKCLWMNSGQKTIMMKLWEKPKWDQIRYLRLIANMDIRNQSNNTDTDSSWKDFPN